MAENSGPISLQNARVVDDLWFSNDTLVIHAENTLFRVSKSILTARSSVFRDMASFPQPDGDPREIFDGSQVVRLHDSAAHVEVFLRAIFDSKYFMPPPAPVEMHVVLGILRLAHKYDVDYLFRRALQHLVTEYPFDLEEIGDVGTISDFQENCIEQHAEVIKVATEVGALWILPAAYYEVCNEGLESFFENSALQEHLTPDQKKTCVLGHTALTAGMLHVHKFMRAERPTCTNPAHCNGVFRKMNERLLRAVSCGDTHVFRYWEDSDWESAAICPQCKSTARDSHTIARGFFWMGLPEIFGLPEWGELEDIRIAAIGE
ncbi:hypothetical protein B0H11DRAFT_1797688 [Mycena galericulata]|nr:hypothetical protein B0H11DRAFT_1797688 [Mycena galericulata]